MQTTLDSLPPLHRDPAFLGMTAAQFLGAFNDNIYRQLAFFVFLEVGANDQQFYVLAVFAIPFLLFSGLAGFLADRVSKRSVILWCKVAEVGIQLLGVAGLAWVGRNGGDLRIPILVILGLMGMHSAFFGPSKYGVLPEMLRPSDLPTANGVFQMTTFVAIVLGWVAAGFLWRRWGGAAGAEVWQACIPCVVIALAGLFSASLLRPTLVARPELKFHYSTLTGHPATWRLIRDDRTLAFMLCVSGVFFVAGGLLHPAVNALGKMQLGLDEIQTSELLGCLAVGIAVGCPLAGRLSAGRIDLRLSKLGAAAVVGFLLLLWQIGVAFENWPAPLQTNIAALALFGVGVGAGFLVVPLQTLIQCRPPADQKGRVLGAMSLFNWVGVVVASMVYAVCVWLLKELRLPPSGMFFAVAAVVAPIAFFLPARVLEAGPNPVEEQFQPLNPVERPVVIE